jgi:hypothetical protein
MKRYEGIDYGQRPASYWEESDVLASLLRNVKGRERREMIRCYWEQGRLEELDPALLQDALSEDVRERLGRIHPMFMGGEYLPDYKAEEVEIARVELESVTSDVISIRARRGRRRIVYRVVDEYGSEFSQPQKTGTAPFTLAGLVRFLDCCWQADGPGGIILGYNEMNLDGGTDRERYRHFTRVCSEFYPQLEAHYEHVFEDWVAAGKELRTRREDSGKDPRVSTE